MERERLRLASEVVGTPSGGPPAESPDLLPLPLRAKNGEVRGQSGEQGLAGVRPTGNRAEPRRNLILVMFIVDGGAKVPF